jgi:hypothetical protein
MSIVGANRQAVPPRPLPFINSACRHLEVSLQVEREAVTSAQQAVRRAESSLQRLSQRHGTIDLEEYNRLKAEAEGTKVGEAGGARGAGGCAAGHAP